MATAPSPGGDDAASGGSRERRRKPEAIRIAERDIRLAKEALKRAQDGGSETAIKAAKDDLKEAEAALRKIRKADRGEDRQQAREDFMEDYFDRLGPEVANLVKTDPELRKLFDEAIRKGWDAQTFTSELRKTDWWKDPKKGQSWRTAFEMEFQASPGEWQENLTLAKQKIRDMAQELYNMDIPEDVLERIARKYYYQGWNTNERGLQVWLAERFGRQEEKGAELTPGGALLDQERTLRDAARAYGVYRDDDWVSKTSRDILNPNSNYSEDDAWNELIAEAESLYPVFAGKLSKDRSVRDLGAGYISQLARYLEINDPNMIDLTDPLLQKAFTNVNDKGEATALPLWQFTQDIKKDARWQYTTNALDTYSSIGSDLARMMGFVR